MKYYRANRDAYDHFNKSSLIKGELCTPKERDVLFRYIADKCFDTVHSKLLELDKQSLNFFCDIFSRINCNMHDTPCEKCPLCLSGNCVLFLFEVEKYGRLAERR